MDIYFSIWIIKLESQIRQKIIFSPIEIQTLLISCPCVPTTVRLVAFTLYATPPLRSAAFPTTMLFNLVRTSRSHPVVIYTWLAAFKYNCKVCSKHQIFNIIIITIKCHHKRDVIFVCMLYSVYNTKTTQTEHDVKLFTSQIQILQTTQVFFG